MDLLKQIEERIISGSEDFFSPPATLAELRVTLRIAYEFHRFLLKFGETPPMNEVTYMMDTIRSGLDHFFLLAYSCRAIDNKVAKWSFDRDAGASFPQLRRYYLHCFEELCRPEADAGDRLASLLALVHLKLTFLAQNFPSVVLGSF
jgi:hypothetical protein